MSFWRKHNGNKSTSILALECRVRGTICSRRRHPNSSVWFISKWIHFMNKAILSRESITSAAIASSFVVWNGVVDDFDIIEVDHARSPTAQHVEIHLTRPPIPHFYHGTLKF